MVLSWWALNLWEHQRDSWAGLHTWVSRHKQPHSCQVTFQQHTLLACNLLSPQTGCCEELSMQSKIKRCDNKCLLYRRCQRWCPPVHHCQEPWMERILHSTACCLWDGHLVAGSHGQLEIICAKRSFGQVQGCIDVMMDTLPIPQCCALLDLALFRCMTS